MTPGRTLRIALVTRYYPPDPGGGLAFYTQQIAQEMTRQGHEVIVISSTTQNKVYDETDQGAIIRRIPQLKPYQRSITGATCLVNSYRIARTIESLHRTRPFDVVHMPATFYESLIFGQFYKQRLQVPLVIKFHENRETYERLFGRFQTLKGYRRRWLRLLLRRVSLDADYWLGVSASSLASTLDYLDLTQHPCPQYVSPSPVDLDFFKPTVAPINYFQQFGLSPQTPFLLYSGRLIYEKGLHLLAEAFLKHLAPRFPQLHLAIAGEFDYRQPRYEQQIRQQMAGHPDAGRIIFAGRIPHPEMPYWYTHCQAFVAPSLCEPFGRIYVEAMACQAPTVGFNSGGPREIITHSEDGYLVMAQTSDGLAHALIRLLESPQLQDNLRRNSRNKVREHFSKEKITSDLLAVYAQLAGQFTDQTKPSPARVAARQELTE